VLAEAARHGRRAESRHGMRRVIKFAVAAVLVLDCAIDVLVLLGGSLGVAFGLG